MKIFIVAAAAWAAGALLGYFVARLAYKHLRKRLRTLRQERKPPKKKMGTMDRILVLEAVFLVAYTVADLVVFWHTGSEPATLTGCVFGVCGLENGVMGWIKTNNLLKNQRWHNHPCLHKTVFDAPSDIGSLVSVPSPVGFTCIFSR